MNAGLDGSVSSDDHQRDEEQRAQTVAQDRFNHVSEPRCRTEAVDSVWANGPPPDKLNGADMKGTGPAVKD